MGGVVVGERLRVDAEVDGGVGGERVGRDHVEGEGGVVAKLHAREVAVALMVGYVDNIVAGHFETVVVDSAEADIVVVARHGGNGKGTHDKVLEKIFLHLVQVIVWLCNIVVFFDCRGGA